MTNPSKTVSELGLTVESVFVPLSRSRNANTDWPSLNWKVTVKRNGRDILTTDYGAGIAHAPGYEAERVPACFMPRNYRNASTGKVRPATAHEALNQWREYLAGAECESGFAMEAVNTWARVNGHEPNLKPKRKRDEKGNTKALPIKPDSLYVLHSLVMDSSVLDAGGFESWAGDLGYDTDSIKAKCAYDACLEIALAMRSALGDSGMAALNEAFQDY